MVMCTREDRPVREVYLRRKQDTMDRDATFRATISYEVFGAEDPLTDPLQTDASSAMECRRKSIVLGMLQELILSRI